MKKKSHNKYCKKCGAKMELWTQQYYSEYYMCPECSTGLSIDYDEFGNNPIYEWDYVDSSYYDSIVKSNRENKITIGDIFTQEKSNGIHFGRKAIQTRK